MLQDLSSGEWWQETEQLIKERWPDEADLQLNPFLLFSDGAELDAMGRNKSKVVMQACGNFRNHILRRTCSRELVALIPDIECTSQQGKVVAVSRARRFIFHRCMEILCDHITVSRVLLLTLSIIIPDLTDICCLTRLWETGGL